MKLEILTKADLAEFKREFLDDIKEIFKANVDNQPKYLRTKQVLELLQISQSSLQNYRVKGLLKPIKVGGTIFYAMKDVTQLMENSRVA